MTFVKIFCRIATKFNKSTDQDKEGFFDAENWQFIRDTGNKHAKLVETDAFSTSKVSNSCNTSDTRNEERQFWSDAVEESVKSMKSVVPKIKPNPDGDADQFKAFMDKLLYE